MESLELTEFYKGKKVFVTGHTGFKGCWLTTFLLKMGAEVCGYGLEPNTAPNMYSLLKLEDVKDFKFKSIIGDVRDYDKLLKAMEEFKPEIVLHLAAQPIVLTGYQKPRYTYETNVMGTVNVLEAIRQIKSVRSFVNVTTDKVYLNNDSGNAFKETDSLCGYDPYSNSKSCSELVTYSYQKSFFNEEEFYKHDVSISTCRAGNVIGGGDWGDFRLIPDFIRSINKHVPIEIRNPHSTRPFQFVMEPVFMYLKIAMMQYKNNKFAGNYNIGPDIDNCLSVKDILSYFIKYQPNVKYVVNQVANANHEASKLVLDNSKIKEVFGYKPVYGIEDCIKNICAWNRCFNENHNMLDETLDQINAFMDKADHIYL